MPAALLVTLAAADPREAILERRLHELTAGYDACFVLHDVRAGRTLRVNEAECRWPLSPCSTFKIFNSLAGLQSGVLKSRASGSAAR